MLRLLLLRHAKSSWDDPGLGDHDRPLAARGRRAATAVGRHMAAHGLVPERVLCSGARRARDTLALVLPAMADSPEPRTRDVIYAGDAWAILDLIRGEGGAASPLLVVGHNPALQELALGLIVPEAAKPADDDLAAKFPTGALAVIDFAIAAWGALDWGTGRLAAFVRPRDLAC